MASLRVPGSRWMFSIFMVSFCFGGWSPAAGEPSEPKPEESAPTTIDSKHVSSMIAGAGIGVAVTGFALRSTNLATTDGKEFNPKPLMITGVALFVVGAVSLALAKGGHEDSPPRHTAPIAAGRSRTPLSIAVGTDDGRGLTVGVKGGF